MQKKKVVLSGYAGVLTGVVMHIGKSITHLNLPRTLLGVVVVALFVGWYINTRK